MYDDELIFAELAEMIAVGADRYASLKQECEERVSRWEWRARHAYSLEPYWFEIHGYKPGRKLSSRPDKITNEIEYGFDAAGRNMVEHHYDSSGGLGIHYERFTVHSHDKIDEYVYKASADEPIVTKVSRAYLVGNKIHRLYSVSGRHRSSMTHEYEGDLLTRIVGKLQTPEQSPEYNYQLKYDEFGGLVQVVCNQEGYSSVRFAKQPANVKQRRAELTRLLTDRIVADFPRLIELFKSEHPGEHCYGIVLTNVGHGPNIECTFGTEEALQTHVTRREAERGRGNERSLILQADRWSQYDFFYFYDFDEESVLKPLQQAYGHGIFEQDCHHTWDILLEALVKLNDSGLLTAEFGPDTVAVAIENEEDDRYMKSLKKANPKAVVHRVLREFKEADKAYLRVD